MQKENAMTIVQTHVESELSREQVEAIVTLTNSVWPKEGLTLEQRIESLWEEIQLPERQATNPRRLVVWEDQTAIAHALVFHREVHFVDDDRETLASQNVLALAGVCTDSTRRGLGLGVMVVKEAFKHVDTKAPVCLFQTGVTEFYEKFDARVVENKFINRLNDDAPAESPWWDSSVMIFPAKFRWPREIVDLNGAGY